MQTVAWDKEWVQAGDRWLISQMDEVLRTLDMNHHQPLLMMGDPSLKTIVSTNLKSQSVKLVNVKKFCLDLDN